jgi:hypothetical protein
MKTCTLVEWRVGDLIDKVSIHLSDDDAATYIGEYICLNGHTHRFEIESIEMSPDLEQFIKRYEHGTIIEDEELKGLLIRRKI